METLVKTLFRHISNFFFSNFLQSQTIQQKQYPVEEWAKRAEYSNVALSPNGEKLALLRIKIDWRESCS